MKKKIIIIGLVAGMAGAMISMGATKQVIRMDETVSESTEAAIEDAGAVEESMEASIEDAGAAEESMEASSEIADTADEGIQGTEEPVKMWGQVLTVEEGSFSFERQFPEGGSEEVIVHIDPEQTLLLDADGYPAGQDSIKAGEVVYVYPGSAMTLSLPAQTTAQVVFVGIPQDAGAPEYVAAAGSLADDGQGGFLFTTTGGREFKVPADCQIIPYLTRQMVRLEDIQEGSRCLLWLGADGAVEKIVLFHQE